MSPHAAAVPYALEALNVILGSAGGWMPVYRVRDGRERLLWCRAAAPGLASLILDLEARYGGEIALGPPEAKRFNGGVTFCSVLWARVDSPDRLARARRFKVRPTVALQDGRSSRLLLWWLNRPATYFEVEAANRKLAYHFRAVQKYGEPDRLRVPCPGTCVREGRSRPLPVRVARLTTDSFDLEQVVGRLKEPPPKDAWRGVAA